MATKVPKSARFTMVLDAGLHPVTSNPLRKSVSISNLVPGSDVEDVNIVATVIGSLLLKPITTTTITEVFTIV